MIFEYYQQLVSLTLSTLINLCKVSLKIVSINTTRGFDQNAFEEVANIIADRLLNPTNEEMKDNCLKRVESLCNKFPLYSKI